MEVFSANFSVSLWTLSCFWSKPRTNPSYQVGQGHIGFLHPDGRINAGPICTLTGVTVSCSSTVGLHPDRTQWITRRLAQSLLEGFINPPTGLAAELKHSVWEWEWWSLNREKRHHRPSSGFLLPRKLCGVQPRRRNAILAGLPHRDMQESGVHSRFTCTFWFRQIWPHCFTAGTDVTEDLPGPGFLQRDVGEEEKLFKLTVNKKWHRARFWPVPFPVTPGRVKCGSPC